jgi:hypothetical protein
MTQEFQVRFDLIIGRLGRVFKVVENVDFSGGSLRCNNIVSLGHVSGSVNFARVVDLHFYLDALILGGRARDSGRIAVVILVVTSVF